MMEPVPILTVGDLKSELSRWSDETPVTFRSPLKEQEFRFYRYRPGEKLLVLESMNFRRHRPRRCPPHSRQSSALTENPGSVHGTGRPPSNRRATYRRPR